MPSSSQRSTIPPRSARSSSRLSATSTAAIGDELDRLVELAAVDVRQADALDQALVEQAG